MRMLIVGAGATGGFFGGRLAQAGRDVTFLVRGRRAAQLRDSGLRIASPQGDATIRPKLVTAGEIDGAYDAVLLTVKAFALDAALEDFAPAVGPDTCIVPVLNGMRHMDRLAERFGKQAVAGGAAKVATTLDESGVIMQLAPFQDIAYGEMDGSRSERMQALDRFMRQAGFEARLSENIALEMWEKWALLATLGGITCLMRGNVGEIAAAAGGDAFLLRFFGEVTSIICAVGIPVSDACRAFAMNAFRTQGSPLTSSMYRDLQNHQPVEADQIIGDLLARGRKAGLSTPLLEAAYTQLSIYQARLTAARPAASAI
jgi:2-dehydropantoate 2-reductase